MLAELSVRDIVLIDRLDLALGPGLNVLTGETGAGKSILLDALGLALGGRADAGLVRAGAPQGSVAARFDLPVDHPANALLADQGIDAGEGMLLRRVLGSDGKSRAFVNDQPVGVALLRRIGDLLVEVHGQNDAQGLLDATTHRQLLDAFAGLGATADEVRAAFDAKRRAEVALDEADARLAAARRDEDYARHMLAELDTLDPDIDEEEKLAAERAALQAQEKIVAALADADAQLNDAGGVEKRLRGALRAIERVADRVGGKLDPVRDALDRAASDLADALALLDQTGRALDADPRALEKIEERLFALRAAARKHATSVAGLSAVRDRFRETLAAIADGGAELQRLTAAAAAAARTYAERATKLSQARAKAAAKLDRAVAAELAPLKLGAARFVTQITTSSAADGGPDGIDRVGFAVATNPGATPGPLAKIASGGELSRLMLALKAVLAGQGSAATLVFDEVDQGVGGATATAVGERLARLAQTVQVLVVTHSPQVAALGRQHFVIAKSSPKRNVTVTSVTPLADDQRRIEEIARMLSGAEVTDAARAAARALREIKR